MGRRLETAPGTAAAAGPGDGRNAARHLAGALRPHGGVQRDRAQRFHCAPGAWAVGRHGRALARRSARGQGAGRCAPAGRAFVAAAVAAGARDQQTVGQRTHPHAAAGHRPGRAWRCGRADPAARRSSHSRLDAQQGHRRWWPGAGQRIGSVAQRAHHGGAARRPDSRRHEQPLGARVRGQPADRGHRWQLAPAFRRPPAPHG